MSSPTADKSVQHLFNSDGRWIAFRVDRYVFDTSGGWIGWLPWQEPDRAVVDVQGHYVGTIFPGDRFYRELTFRPRGYPGYPGYPSYPGYPGYPGFAGPATPPPLAEDIRELATQ